MDSVAVAHGLWSAARSLWHVDLVALWRVHSSRTRAQTGSLALQDGFLTIGPPEKPWYCL